MATYIALKKHQATPLLDQYQDSLKKACKKNPDSIRYRGFETEAVETGNTSTSELLPILVIAQGELSRFDRRRHSLARALIG